MWVLNISRFLASQRLLRAAKRKGSSLRPRSDRALQVSSISSMSPLSGFMRGTTRGSYKRSKIFAISGIRLLLLSMTPKPCERPTGLLIWDRVRAGTAALLFLRAPQRRFLRRVRSPPNIFLEKRKLIFRKNFTLGMKENILRYAAQKNTISKTLT